MPRRSARLAEQNKAMTLALPRKLRALITELPKPVCAYVYDLEGLRQRARELSAVLPSGLDLFYAVKANPDPKLLATLLPFVKGFEAASLGEVERAREISESCEITLGGPAKTDHELAGALRAGVRRIHLESAMELRRLQAVAFELRRKVPVLLRISPMLGSEFPSEYVRWQTQFGIDQSSLPEVLELLRASPNLVFEGFHFHVLSNNRAHELHAAVGHELLRRSVAWARDFDLPLSHINLGGGMGIAYEKPGRDFDWNAFVVAMQSAVATQASAGRRVVLECGRFLTAHCGYYVTEVLDVKRNHGKNFVVVRGGTHHLRLPASHGHSQPSVLLPAAERPLGASCLRNVEATIVGQLCTPTDVLARDVSFAEVGVGDTLVFAQAGAYGWTISPHDFLCHPHPDRYFLE